MLAHRYRHSAYIPISKPTFVYAFCRSTVEPTAESATTIPQVDQIGDRRQRDAVPAIGIGGEVWVFRRRRVCLTRGLSSNNERNTPIPSTIDEATLASCALTAGHNSLPASRAGRWVAEPSRDACRVGLSTPTKSGARELDRCSIVAMRGRLHSGAAGLWNCH